MHEVTPRIRLLPPSDNGNRHFVCVQKFPRSVFIHVGQVSNQPTKLPLMNNLLMATPHHATSAAESPVTTLINGLDDEDARSLCSRFMTRAVKYPLMFSWDIGEMYPDERIEFHKAVLEAVSGLLSSEEESREEPKKEPVHPIDDGDKMNVKRTDQLVRDQVAV
eukprot:Protomagalhaensia_wolfi_Nauph_80__3677@NODE_3709_length_729_cov_132_884058_g2923_i0_p1_GENE_NODE_3709_length_729_cov_132_884058_g2923_i0NODE_3709_length_729_cov_132_884058_g2923_i0_p1_ORF_typecomplete_len164_score23_46PAC4/PF16093_5/8_8e05_NODE_3709_length_729_cov_132_884058_g2923_i059550